MHGIARDIGEWHTNWVCSPGPPRPYGARMPIDRRPLPWRRRALLRAHVEAAAAASVRPARAERFLVYGADPLRVLLIGSGLAVGHGVDTRARALDGRVGGRLAEATGRGVIVNNYSDERLRLADQVQNAMSGGGFDLEDVVIWCPSYGEMPERPWSTPWFVQMRRFLAAVSEETPLIISQLPEPIGTDPAAAVAAPIIRRINRGLHRAAGGRANTFITSPPVVQVKPHGQPLFDADYYAAAAGPIAERALDLITRPSVAARRRPSQLTLLAR